MLDHGRRALSTHRHGLQAQSGGDGADRLMGGGNRGGQARWVRVTRAMAWSGLFT